MSAALTDSLPKAAPDHTSGAAWAPSEEILRFFLGGREIGSVRLNAMTLATPFSHLSTNLAESAPSRETFAAGVDAFVVPAQPVATAPPRISFLPGMIRYAGPETNRYSISLNGTFADYMRKFGAKSRHNLTRSVKKFAEFCGGQIRWETFATPEEMRGFYRAGDEIARRSWGAELGGAGLAKRMPEVQLVELAREGSALGVVLFHGERPVAYVLCRAHGERLLYEFIAYDQEYAKRSPGSVLFYLLVEKLFASQQFDQLDLGEGTLWYKSFFATDSTRCARVMYCRRTLKNFALVFVHYGLCTASVAAGKVLRAIGVKRHLKRLMMGKMLRPGQDRQ